MKRYEWIGTDTIPTDQLLNRWVSGWTESTKARIVTVIYDSAVKSWYTLLEVEGG